MKNSDWNDLRVRYERARDEMWAVTVAVRKETGIFDYGDSPIFDDGETSYRFMWAGNHYRPEEVGRVENAKERFKEMKEAVRGIQV